MAKSLVPVSHGRDYQARFFWLKASGLFDPGSKVSKVGFEAPDAAKSFEDVVVWYREPIHDPVIGAVKADYFQAKFHVTPAGSITADALMDPKFIGAEAYSLLQKLKTAQQTYASGGKGARFSLVLPWNVHPDDTLAELVDSNLFAINLERLMQGGERGKFGKVRIKWRKHLGLRTDDELRPILATLRFRSENVCLEQMKEGLRLLCQSCGMKPWTEGTIANAYDQLPWKLHAEGVTSFTRDELVEILKREELWTGGAAVPEPPVGKLVGIRSFMRWAQDLEERCDDTLCLLRHFQGRWIRDADGWRSDVASELHAFLDSQIVAGTPMCLELQTHASIAFATGRHLGSMSGVDLSIVQRSMMRNTVWRADDAEVVGATVWTDRSTQPANDDTGEIALLLSVAQDCAAEAKDYIARRVPSVRHVIDLVVGSGVSRDAVKNGAHASKLAELAISAVQGRSTLRKRGSPVHLFAAIPNGLMLMLGQHSGTAGKWTLYEHDPKQDREEPYYPSMSL